MILIKGFKLYNDGIFPEDSYVVVDHRDDRKRTIREAYDENGWLVACERRDKLGNRHLEFFQENGVTVKMSYFRQHKQWFQKTIDAEGNTIERVQLSDNIALQLEP